MCLGFCKRFCHWGPLIAVGIMKAVTFATVVCQSLWWPPNYSWSASVLFFTFMSSATFSLYFFLQAMYIGPGVLPKGWAPRLKIFSIYIFIGGLCIMKMDHHCPWINNCVGHKNHTAFNLFLFWAVVGCTQATYILGATIYRGVNRNCTIKLAGRFTCKITSPTWYIYFGSNDEPIVYMSLWGMVVCMFVFGLAIGVVLAVGMLLYFQIRGVLRNRTGIEDWIVEKACHRRARTNETFVYPYNLGKWRNITQIINFWCEPVGDGIVWPVREGCNQYTLTMEQIAQKEEKRARSQEYLIVRPYSGWWFPCTHGIRVCCHPPCTDEPRIWLVSGNTVLVTRWKKYWLYGERKIDPSLLSEISVKLKRQRGWFPRHCAVQVLSSENTAEHCDSYKSADSSGCRNRKRDKEEKSKIEERKHR